MIKTAIVVGSTRPGRKAEAVARWVYDIAKKRNDAEFEVVDIKDFNLPLLDEATPPSTGKYSQPHTKAWAAKIASFDAFVFVTPEYNHGTSGALKNALDWLVSYPDFAGKPVVLWNASGAGGDRAQAALIEILQTMSARVLVEDSLLVPFLRKKLAPGADLPDDAALAVASSLAALAAAAR